MPQFYERKSARASRSSIQLLRAAAGEVEAGSSIREAASKHDFDKMTLSRYIKKSKEQWT